MKTRRTERRDAGVSLSTETQRKLDEARRVLGCDGDAAIAQALDLLLGANKKQNSAEGVERGQGSNSPASVLASLPEDGAGSVPSSVSCRRSLWEELPYTVAECLYEKLGNSAAVHVRHRLLQVCQSWRRQFVEFVDTVPAGLSITNRRCCWKLCSGDGSSRCSTRDLVGVRALGVGVRRLPTPRLITLPQALPRLERLDLHFPPTFNLSGAEHLQHLKAIGEVVPSLGLQFRSFGLPHQQVTALQQLPSLHRLSYKIHRSQSHQSLLRGHACALQALTQLQELSLRVSFEGFLPARFGCLSILATIPALTSLTVRTRQEYGNWIELPKLGGLSMLTSLRRLDIDGMTELRPGDALLLSALTRLETLILRNSAYLRLSHLTSLTRLTSLRRLDYSLHGEYVEASLYSGEEDAPCGSVQRDDPLRALLSMTALTDLDLANRLDFSFKRDVGCLLQMTSLTKLNLCQTLRTLPFQHALSALVSLRQLQALNLEGYTEDLSPVTQLHSLHHLSLRSCLMVDSELLEELATCLPSLAILDIADCPATSPDGVLAMLKRLPVLWALGLSGHAISIDVVAQLHGMTGLQHLYVDRMSRARLTGVTCRAYTMSNQSRNGAANLVRQYLTTELPGRLREFTMFYRNGYIDFPDWDGWWLTREEDVLSDREYSDSDSSILGSDGGYSSEEEEEEDDEFDDDGEGGVPVDEVGDSDEDFEIDLDGE